MKPLPILLVALSMLSAGAAVAAIVAADNAQEVVVRRYVQAWNDADAEAFLAQATADAGAWRRGDGENLPGQPLFAEASPQARSRYYRAAFAKRPHPRIEILGLQSLDDMVVARERVTGTADGKTVDGLTVYQVRNDKICNVWHIKRRSR